MHIDARIIRAHGRCAVLAQQHEVMWRDGSALWLHHVQIGGLDAPLLRALQVDGEWALLDIARALPALADDMRVQPRRDSQGLIWFHLRGRWGSADGFIAHIRPHLQPLRGGGGAAFAGSAAPVTLAVAA